MRRYYNVPTTLGKGVREIDNDALSPTAAQPRPIGPPSPVTGYALTTADSAKGGRVKAERERERRERARMSAEEIIREEIEKELREWTRDLMRASRETGNPAAFRELTHRAYGPPVQRQEIEDVTERSTDVQADLAELARIDAQLKGSKAA